MTQWIGGLGIIMFTDCSACPSSESAACRCSPPRPAAPHMTRFIPVSVSPPNGFGVSMPDITALLVGPADAWRYGLVRQYLPCICHYRYRWLLHQAGQRCLLQFSLYRICHLHFHVYLRHQLHLAIIVRQPEIQEVHRQCRAEILFLVQLWLFTAVIAIVLYYTSPMGMEECLPQILVPGNLPPHLHRFCDR